MIQQKQFSNWFHRRHLCITSSEISFHTKPSQNLVNPFKFEWKLDHGFKCPSNRNELHTLNSGKTTSFQLNFSLCLALENHCDHSQNLCVALVVCNKMVVFCHAAVAAGRCFWRFCVEMFVVVECIEGIWHIIFNETASSFPSPFSSSTSIALPLMVFVMPYISIHKMHTL